MPIRCLSAILLFSLLVLFVVPLYGQDDVSLPADRAVITPENVAQLQPLGRFGTGELSDAFAWSPDESTLAIGGATGIWLYASDALTTPSDFIPTERYVDRLGFSPDGRYLAYRTRGYIVYLLDYATRTELQTFEDADAFAFHPVQPLLAVATFGVYSSEDQDIVVPTSTMTFWDIQTRQIHKAFNASDSDWGDDFVNLDFSATGTLFAAAWESGAYSSCGEHRSLVRWWNFDDILALSEEELSDYTNTVGSFHDNQYGIKFHPTENTFASVQTSDLSPNAPTTTINIYDLLADEVNEYDITSSTSPSLESITSFDFVPNGDYLHVVVDRGSYLDDSVYTLNLDDGTASQDTRFSGQITGYAAAPHLTVAMNGQYRIAHDSGDLVSIGAPYVWIPNGVNDDGSAFFSRDFDGLRRLWVFSDAGEVEEIPLPPAYQGWQPSFIPGGRIIKFDAEADERRFALWDFEAGTAYEFDSSDLRGDWRNVDFSLNGERMAVQRTDGRIEIHDTSTGARLSTLDFEFDSRVLVVFSPDGTHLTTAHFVDTGDFNTSTIEVREWVSDTGALHRDFGSFANSSIFRETNQGQLEVLYSTDGTLLGLQTAYVHAEDESNTRTDDFMETYVFDVTSGETIFTFHEGNARYIWGLFSSDFQLYALERSDGFSGAVYLFDVQSGRPLGGERAHIRGGAQMFSPDNTHLLTSEGSVTGCGGDFRSLSLHTVDSLVEVSEIYMPSIVMGRGGERSGFSPDSRMLMISTDSGTEFYDAQSGELITTIEGLDNSRLHFSANGTLLIAARDDGTVTLWGIPTDNAN